MKAPEFDTFVAIDWSGASRHYTGIAVAACDARDAAPTLIQRGHRWTRSAVADWLSEELRRNSRMLVGLDFAFGFPFEQACGYLAGTAPVRNIFDLWSLIDEKSGAEPDFGCGEFLRHPDHSKLFWARSSRPTDWVGRKRRTELVCAEGTGTYPDTLYKLIGPKQVGKASLTGMRVLHDVRSRCRDVAAVWPFERGRRSVLVEIYPTLFRKRATNSVKKILTWEALDDALKVLGSRPMRRRPNPPTDHETDALLSAAGLRTLAGDPASWRIDKRVADRVSREGWIFGVLAADCTDYSD